MHNINLSHPRIFLLDTDFLYFDATNNLLGLNILSTNEKTTYAAFKFEKDQILYLTAHYLKRCALSLIHPEVTPNTWVF